MKEPTHQCGNCDTWLSRPHDYCPECGYAAVDECSPECGLCLNEMEYRGTRGEIRPWYQYYCPTCDREWAVPHIDVAD